MKVVATEAIYYTASSCQMISRGINPVARMAKELNTKTCK